MSFNIAIAGKGGSGKTSVASLVIRYLKRNGMVPILAVDADPNANLGESLGFEIDKTVGVMLNDFQRDKINIPSGMTKETYLDYKMNELLIESKGLDLLTMGRGEGPECYCYPNVILKKFADTLSDNYAYTVLDNEAGMEHLSRRTTQNIDALLLVSNHSVKGVRTIARIMELASELNLVIKRQLAVVNMVPGKLDTAVSGELERLGIQPVAIIPEDEELLKFDLEMKSLLDIPETSEAVSVVNGLMGEILEQASVAK